MIKSKVWFEKWLVVCFFVLCGKVSRSTLGVNWGTNSINPMPPGYLVKMLQQNNITKVKLFDADYHVVSSMAGTGIEVMVAAPNDMLYNLATDPNAAPDWVKENVTQFLFNGGVNIRWVAVGNEPFLSSYEGIYVNTTFPAFQNIQNALIQAGHSEVRAIIPFNADIMTDAPLPSQTTFKPEFLTQVMQVLNVLNSTGAPFSVNLYPFISKYQNPEFPLDFAFFDGSASPVHDGSIVYENSFDASYDSLVSALSAAGFPNMPIVIGEIGWPTDGNVYATIPNAQKFNQEFINHVQTGLGTPLRPNMPFEAYLFSLIDEDIKSILPGPFERHWGLLYFDGVVKYPLDLSAGTNAPSTTLTGVQYPPYMSHQYCVLNPNVDLTNLTENVAYACSRSDCTPLYTGSSCAFLDAVDNASYAFNSYFQFQNQNPAACNFQGLGEVTTQDPSQGTCRFILGLIAETPPSGARSRYVLNLSTSLTIFVLLSILLIFT
ncbi:unnamed protein product [Sphagnum troendelagicum]|uniref:X8 domain-containing protein n=1 Tax=Sphagnum troendelagicum TaxID=128251 RepID=A0ABP0UZH9_9BRYO